MSYCVDENLIGLRVRLPFNLGVPMPPNEPFYRADGSVGWYMRLWLEKLVESFHIFELMHAEPSPSGGDPVFYVYVRTPRNRQEPATRVSAGEYSEFDEADKSGETEIEQRIEPEDRDTADNPLICKFQKVLNNGPDDVRFYLSDFRGNGAEARGKLLEIIQIVSQ